MSAADERQVLGTRWKKKLSKFELLTRRALDFFPPCRFRNSAAYSERMNVSKQVESESEPPTTSVRGWCTYMHCSA